MTIHTILKMGDPRLLRVAQPVRAFDTPELHALVADMRETMASVNGAGLAAPQIGVDLQLVIFGSGTRNRFPPPAWLAPLIAPRLGLETKDTPAASRTYNNLASEGRNVVAALILEA